MIVWVAGWPHCGSTLLRTFLKDVFGLESYSKYKETELQFLFGDASLYFSHHWGPKLYVRTLGMEGWQPVKTHEFPFDGCPSLYVVRDGRDACASLARFWQLPVRDVILGENTITSNRKFGTWSTHYHAWNPKARSNCALIRFDEILSTPEVVADRIAALLNLPIVGTFVDRFDDHKDQWPRMYDDKNDELRSTIQGEDLDLFWRVNGPVMRELGYMPTETP